MPKYGSIVLDDATLQKALQANAEGATYTGSGDNMLDFRAASSFIDEAKGNKRFTIKVKNSGSADKIFRLNDVLSNPEGSILLSDGTAEGITVTASPRKVSVLQHYLALAATRVCSIKLNVDDPVQLDQPINYVECTPWATDTVKTFIPSNYQSSNTNNPKMSEIDDCAGMVLSDAGTIYFAVQAGREVTLIITFGASLDMASAVNKKAEDAALTVAAAYLRNQNA